VTGNSFGSGGVEPWLEVPVTSRAQAEARDAPIACVVRTINDQATALGVTAVELAGILGITQLEWHAFLRRWPDVAVDGWLDSSLRLLCELFGSVLTFADEADGARWLRTHHPAMGDSPLGRLIRSPSALPWMSAALLAERGR
jgi:hypothetical protein